MAWKTMMNRMGRKVYQMSTHLHTRPEFVGNDLHQRRFSSTFAGSLLARCTKTGKCDAHDKHYSGKFDRLRAIFEDCFLHDLTEKGIFLEGSIEEYKGLILAKRPKPKLLSVEDFTSWFLRTPEVYKKDIQQLIEKGEILIFGKAPRTLLRHKVVLLSNWEKPPPNWDKLNFDGSYIEGENGIVYGAAHASLIRTSSGSVKSTCQGQLPFVRSAFEAELLAALCGINDCLRVGTEKVIVEGDCDDVIRILQGLDSPRLQDRDMFNIIFEKLGLFKDYRIVHIYRERNKAADGLAFATAKNYGLQKFRKCVERDLDDTQLLFRIIQDERKCGL